MTAATLPRLALAALLLAGTAMPAAAETLQEALAAAYRDNPTLTAARAGLKATDENVDIAKSNGRPTANITSQYSQTAWQNVVSPFTADKSLTTTLRASVPIYQGGQALANIKGAEKRVEAGEFDLKSTELSVFSQVVAAYMDVIRTDAITGLSQKNVDVLEVNLKYTRDRFEVGDLTRTDVAQSEARLALARSDLKTAQSQLIAARETYIQVVGHAPVDLQPPPPLPGLPDTPDNAVDIALANNPDLASARKSKDASTYAVRAAQGQRLPTVSVFTQGQHLTYLGSAPDFPGLPTGDQESVAIGAQLTLPLYQGGAPGARVRQSKAQEEQAIEKVTSVERNVVAQTRSLYSSWQANNEVIASNKVAVDANSLSLQGVRAENTVGTRTILDILNAEQEEFSSQVQLVTAQRNAYVAGFSLLAAMGKASAADLNLDAGPLYDPSVYYKKVRNNWNDWSDGPNPKPISSSTVDSPVQNATVSGPIDSIGTP